MISEMSHCITIAVMRVMLVKREYSISFLAFQSPALVLLYLIECIKVNLKYL